MNYETVSYDIIECPYCGISNEDFNELGMVDGETQTFFCPDCDKKFICECSISKIYTATRTNQE